MRGVRTETVRSLNTHHVLGLGWRQYRYGKGFPRVEKEAILCVSDTQSRVRHEVVMDEKRPEVVIDAEQVLKRETYKDVGGSVLFTAAIFGSIAAPVSGLLPDGAMLPLLGGITLAFLGWTMINKNRMARTVRNAKSVIQVYDEKNAALKIAHDIISPEYGDVAIADERWANVRQMIERVRKLSEADLDTQTVIDDISTYLIEQFRDLQSLSEAVQAEAAMSEETEDCDARLAKLQSAADRANARLTRLIHALRDVHVELTMRDAHTSEGLTQTLRDLFHQLQADNEVSAIPDRLPKEEISSDAISGRMPQKGTERR